MSRPRLIAPRHAWRALRRLDKDFEKLEKERKAKTKTAPRQANRNRDPSELGLKPYGGAYLGPR